MLTIARPSHDINQWYTGIAASPTTTVSNAFTNAVKFFETELSHKGSDRTWIKGHTSMKDVILVVQQAQSKYEAHSEKTAKVRKWIDAFASSVSQYGAVLDVVSNADPVHVGLVWGAMKFVFAGVLQHRELVTELSKALVKISKVLPRVQVDALLYQTPWMQDAVSRLYAHILLFLQKAVKWYNGSSVRRAVSGIFQPYQLAFKDTVDEITSCLDEADAVARTANRAELRGLSLALADLVKDQIASRQQSQQRLLEMQARLNELQASSQRSELMLVQAVQTATNQSTLMQSIKLDTGEIRLQVSDLHFAKILDVLHPTVLPEDILRIHDSYPQARISWQQPSRDTPLIMQQLKAWAGSSGSSIIMIQAGPRASSRISDMVFEVTKLLTSTIYPVFWHISPPSKSIIPAADYIFKSLIFQMLRHDPAIVSKTPHLNNIEAFRGLHSLQELGDLAVLVFSHVPECFIVLETQSWQHGSNLDDLPLKEFCRVLESFFTKVIQAGTIIKMLVVAHGVRGSLLPESSAYSQFTATMGPPLPASRRFHQPVTTRLRGRGAHGRGTRLAQINPTLMAR